ncbi:RNA methyltransferase [marine bacterium AO1-C]|nr:RNA methyltransferase [marine bacterium AO1-C]
MRKLLNEELDRLTVDDFKTAAKKPIIVILDNIRSMHNVGSAFRTSDAFLVEKIYLCGITAQPPHREIQKTALGATESVAWAHAENTLDLVKQLQNDGWKVAAIEQADESFSLEKYNFAADEKYAFVFGNEVFGVAEEVVKQADFCLEIPQFGTKHSLNISVSMGVVIWDYFSKTTD